MGGFPNHGFENGIINRLIHRINRTIRGINRLILVINSPTEANKAIDRSANAWGGQLAAGVPQVDRPSHSSVPIRPLTDR